MTRSKKLLGYAALSAATFLCTAGIAVAETRVALVIGNAAYEKLSPLSNPVIDAERMAQMLAANGFDVMSCDGAKPGCFNLDRSGMTDALEAFELKARGADVAMVFYAGHGMQTAKGNVLAPVNMELSCDTLDPLKATMLDNVMDALSDAKDKIIIIDACRNDPFQAQQCAQRGGRSLSFGSIAVPDSDSRFLLMSSTKPGQFAADGLPGAHSPFAESLFYWMEQQPNAYFDQLLDRVAKRVIERSTEAKFTQVPEVLIRGGAPESCLSGDCSTDPEGAALRNEVAALKVENERSQEYEEIVTTMLRSAGYTSLEELPADQRDSFFKGIVSASRALGERNDSAGEQALAALKQGDENAAAALFEQELEERAKGAASELTKAAESARHLAALAWPKDVAKAAKYFGEATRYDPNNIQTWMDYAQTSQASGNTSEALRAYGEATRLAAQDGTVSQRIWATLGQGDIVRAQGRLDRALELYVSANDLAQENSAALPGDLNARREIYASHLVIGDIQMEQGKLDASAKSYEDGLAIMREVSAANPQVSEWQRDISITLNRIGDVRSQQGRLAASLQAYEEGRDIVARLVEAEPNVVGWQRDLSISHERIGNAQFARGDLAAALVAYRQSLELRQAIAAMDPTNKEWQRDLSFSYERLADVRMAQGGLQAALESYEESRAIRKKLVEADPAHTGWQRDLAMSSQRIGEALRLLGRLSEAQAEFEFAKETVARLAASDPGNTLWQRDVAYSDTKLGEMWGVLGNPTGALEFYRSALAVTEKLAASDVTNAGLQRELAIAYNRVGDMLKIIADNVGALKSFESAMEISARLSASDPDNTDWQRDVSITYNKIGDALLALFRSDEAQQKYEAGLVIVQKLSAFEPGNGMWTRDVTVSMNRVADAKRAKGDFAGALQAYRESMTILQPLSDSDPQNTEWLRDVALTQHNIGDVSISLGNNDDATTAFEAAIAVSKQLVTLAPANTDWQRDLSLAYGRFGDLLSTLGKDQEASEAFTSALDIAKKLVQLDPGRSYWQRDLSIAYARLGDLRSKLNDVAGALESYRPAFDIAEKLAALDPTNNDWQWDLYVAYWRLAAAGEQPVENFRKGLKIIEDMNAAGRLNTGQVQWIELTRQKVVEAEAAANGTGGNGGATTANSGGTLEAVEDNTATSRSHDRESLNK